MSVVLAGQPNAGKSSLHNQLAGHDAAIVTDIAGTTRDILREQIHLNGYRCEFQIRQAFMMRQILWNKRVLGVPKMRLHQADRILLLIDGNAGLTEQDKKILSTLPEHIPLTIIHNKMINRSCRDDDRKKWCHRTIFIG